MFYVLQVHCLRLQIWKFLSSARKQELIERGVAFRVSTLLHERAVKMIDQNCVDTADNTSFSVNHYDKRALK